MPFPKRPVGYRRYVSQGGDLAKGAAKYDELEKRCAEGPAITVPTITLEGDANGAPHSCAGRPRPAWIFVSARRAGSSRSMASGGSFITMGRSRSRRYLPNQRAIFGVSLDKGA